MQEHKGRNIFMYLMGPVLIQWLITFLVQMSFGMFWAMSTSDPTKLYVKLQTYATEMTVVVAILTVPVMGYLFWKDIKKEKGMEKLFPAEVYGALILAGIGTCISLNTILMLVRLTSVSGGYQTVSQEIYESPFLVQLLGLGVLVPLAEELTYRGMLYRRLREYIGAPWAIISSAVVFGILHGNLVQLVYAGVTGVLLAWLYERTGTLKAPVVLHLVINMTSVIATRLHLFQWMFENIYRVAIGASLTAVLSVFAYQIVKNKTY